MTQAYMKGMGVSFAVLEATGGDHGVEAKK
jgi:hypothetical protein